MLGEKRISVMATRRHGIAAIGVLRPDAVRKHFVLMHGRLPTRDRTDFLEENELGLRHAQSIANLHQDAVPMPGTQSLMRIKR